MTLELPAGVTVGLPVVLAGGATVVMGTAAALSVRAAARPELPSTRWHRPLPPAAATALDRAVRPAALRATGVVVAAVLLGTLATADGPVPGGALVAVTVLVSLTFGPLLSARPHADAGRTRSDTPGPNAMAVGWPAVWWLAVLSLALLTIDEGWALAAILVGYGLVQVALHRRRGGTTRAGRDAIAALALVVSHVAPLDRLPDGRPAWRNPVVSAAHATPGPATVWLTAVVAALALTVDAPSAPPVVPLLFAVVAVVAGVALRAAIIRPFFVGALAPLTAAYGLQAGGRWLAPLDLVVFVVLHATAVAVLHRQAIARHDPRTARAVQFPPRLAIVTSVLVGLTIFTTG